MLAARPLPRTGLVLSPLGLGTAALGDRRDADAETDAAETVTSALANGISYIDTAPHYGLGMAERRAAPALSKWPRGQFVLSTKVGRIIDERAGTERFDFSAAAVVASLDGSLRRLGVRRLDIVYAHDPDHAETQVREEALPTLRALRDEGVIRAIGAGMNQAAMLARFVADPRLDIDVVLLAGRYTLLDQSGLDLLNLCWERGVGVVIGGAFNSGILADPRPGAHFDYRPAPLDLLTRARALTAACERHGVPLAAAALQFGWGHPAVVSVLNGAAGTAELAANLGNAGVTVPAACWEQLRSDRLVPPEVPLPGEQ